MDKRADILQTSEYREYRENLLLRLWGVSEASLLCYYF